MEMKEKKRREKIEKDVLNESNCHILPHPIDIQFKILHSRPQTARNRRTFVNSQWTFLSTSLSSRNKHGSIQSRALLQPKRPSTATERLSSPNKIKSPRTNHHKQDIKVPESQIPLDNESMQCVNINEKKDQHNIATKHIIKKNLENEVYIGPLLENSMDCQSTSDKLYRSHPEMQFNTMNRAEKYRNLAYQAQLKGQYEQAIQDYEVSSEMKPKNAITSFQLARTYERNSQWKDAEQIYKKTLILLQCTGLEGCEDVYEDDKKLRMEAFVYYNLGNIFMHLWDPQVAVQYYTKAIHIGTYERKNQTLLSSQELALCLKQRALAYRWKDEFYDAANDYASAQNQLSLKRVRSMAKTSRTSQLVYKSIPSRDLLGEKKLMTSIDLMQYTSWISIAVNKTPCSRTIEEITVMVDGLQNKFPFFANLPVELCQKLCQEHIVGFANIPPGIVLYHENYTNQPTLKYTYDKSITSGYIYFICRGKVNTFKYNALKTFDNPDSNISDRTFEQFLNETNGSMNIQIENIRHLMKVTNTWHHDQHYLCSMVPGDMFGLQGSYDSTGSRMPSQHIDESTNSTKKCCELYSRVDRKYSAVIAQECDILVLSWKALHDTELLHQFQQRTKVASFFRTTRLFRGIDGTELVNLANYARPVKIVGSRVLCSEGQAVNGIIILKNGFLSEISPSGLRLSREHSMKFDIDNSMMCETSINSINGVPLTVNASDYSNVVHEDQIQAQRAKEYFTQLEYENHPLAFIYANHVTHGFLPPSFLPQKLQDFASLDNSTRSFTAKEIHHGDHFTCISLWVPPRRATVSKEPLNLTRNVTKSALVTTAATSTISLSSCGADILFISASDVVAQLSYNNRIVLQKNVQICQSRQQQVHTKSPVKSTISAMLARHNDTSLVKKYHDTINWESFKRDLLGNIHDEKVLHDSKIRLMSKASEIRSELN